MTGGTTTGGSGGSGGGTTDLGGDANTTAAVAQQMKAERALEREWMFSTAMEKEWEREWKHQRMRHRNRASDGSSGSSTDFDVKHSRPKAGGPAPAAPGESDADEAEAKRRWMRQKQNEFRETERILAETETRMQQNRAAATQIPIRPPRHVSDLDEEYKRQFTEPIAAAASPTGGGVRGVSYGYRRLGDSAFIEASSGTAESLSASGRVLKTETRSQLLKSGYGENAGSAASTDGVDPLTSSLKMRQTTTKTVAVPFTRIVPVEVADSALIETTQKKQIRVTKYVNVPSEEVVHEPYVSVVENPNYRGDIPGGGERWIKVYGTRPIKRVSSVWRAVDDWTTVSIPYQQLVSTTSVQMQNVSDQKIVQIQRSQEFELVPKPIGAPTQQSRELDAPDVHRPEHIPPSSVPSATASGWVDGFGPSVAATEPLTSYSYTGSGGSGGGGAAGVRSTQTIRARPTAVASKPFDAVDDYTPPPQPVRRPQPVEVPVHPATAPVAIEPDEPFTPPAADQPTLPDAAEVLLADDAESGGANNKYSRTQTIRPSPTKPAVRSVTVESAHADSGDDAAEPQDVKQPVVADAEDETPEPATKSEPVVVAPAGGDRSSRPKTRGGRVTSGDENGSEQKEEEEEKSAGGDDGGDGDSSDQQQQQQQQWEIPPADDAGADENDSDSSYGIDGKRPQTAYAQQPRRNGDVLRASRGGCEVMIDFGPKHRVARNKPRSSAASKPARVISGAADIDPANAVRASRSSYEGGERRRPITAFARGPAPPPERTAFRAPITAYTVVGPSHPADSKKATKPKSRGKRASASASASALESRRKSKGSGVSVPPSLPSPSTAGQMAAVLLPPRPKTARGGISPSAADQKYVRRLQLPTGTGGDDDSDDDDRSDRDQPPSPPRYISSIPSVAVRQRAVRAQTTSGSRPHHSNVGAFSPPLVPVSDNGVSRTGNGGSGGGSSNGGSNSCESLVACAG